MLRLIPRRRAMLVLEADTLVEARQVPSSVYSIRIKSQYRLTSDIGLSGYHVSRVVHGEADSAADAASRLGKLFSRAPAIWVNMQELYDLRVARR